MKFADRKVVGWKDRYIKSIAVVERLEVRMRNGFTLTSEERKFYHDTKSLINKYNSAPALTNNDK